MVSRLSLELRPKLKTSLKQYHLLMMQPKMQQAIALLQAPILELTALIEQELERNPLLEKEEPEPIEEEELFSEISPDREVEIDDNHFEELADLDEQYLSHFSESGGDDTQRDEEEEKQKTWDNRIPDRENLFQKLMKQAHEIFDRADQIKIVEEIVGNFNESGYLTTPLEEIALISCTDLTLLKKILSHIQTFEPYGVGAKNPQETLLIQLRCLGKRKTLAYQVVKNHYEDLIHNRIPKISRALKCSYESLQKAIQEIAKLDLHPGLQFSIEVPSYIVPDIIVREEDGHFSVEINDENVPTIHLNARYLRMFRDENASVEVKECIKNYYQSAKWFVRNIYQRNETLTRIVNYLLEKQRPFFDEEEGRLVPLNMKEVASALEVHESTVARAVSNKYVHTPKGTVLLRSFFTHAFVLDEGEKLSSQTVKIILKEIIDAEDKSKPLSDQAISDTLKGRGIPCARRTVAKYRKLFDIPSAIQRRKFS